MLGNGQGVYFALYQHGRKAGPQGVCIVKAIGHASRPNVLWPVPGQVLCRAPDIDAPELAPNLPGYDHAARQPDSARPAVVVLLFWQPPRGPLFVSVPLVPAQPGSSYGFIGQATSAQPVKSRPAGV
jgi:hypothetical protein